MPANCLVCNSKSSLISPDFQMHSNEDICPFTLESIRYCKTRYSVVGKKLCFFMLEPCYSLQRGAITKSISSMITTRRI